MLNSFVCRDDTSRSETTTTVGVAVVPDDSSGTAAENGMSTGSRTSTIVVDNNNLVRYRTHIWYDSSAETSTRTVPRDRTVPVQYLGSSHPDCLAVHPTSLYWTVQYSYCTVPVRQPQGVGFLL